MTRPRKRKPLLLKLGVVLLLLSGGAIVNVTVAWGCETIRVITEFKGSKIGLQFPCSCTIAAGIVIRPGLAAPGGGVEP